MRTSDFEEEISQFSRELYQTYSWFDYNFSQKLAQSSCDFWNNTLNCRLAALSENINILAPSDEYFVTQIRLNKEISVFIRLSKQIIKKLLEESLGNNKKSFNIEKLTELEARILTEFNNFVYRNFEFLILKGNELPKKNLSYDECNLTYFLKDGYSAYGKLIITIPIVALKPQKITQREEPVFSIEDFLHSEGEVNIEVGKTRLRLNDLKQLETGDVVMLDYSHAGEMVLSYEGEKRKMRVVPNPALMIDFDVNDESGGKSMNDIYNMWDTIQVELGAEFEKVKLSLGELKQISEGLVVDIGSVYDNKIDLKVEEKIIATGELVIINDRYGVRINEIFTEEKNSASESAQYVDEEPVHQEEQPQEYQQPAVDEEVNEEDFDYSDFDVDEEDI